MGKSAKLHKRVSRSKKPPLPSSVKAELFNSESQDAIDPMISPKYLANRPKAPFSRKPKAIIIRSNNKKSAISKR